VLLDALALLTARDAAVRDAALALVLQYLQPAVLAAVCAAGPQDMEEDGAVVTATQAAADGQAAAAAAAAATQPQRLLLKHLQGLLEASEAGDNGNGACVAGGGVGGAESVVAAKTALMRALAGLFPGLLGSGCEDVILLQLLQQSINENAQVCGGLSWEVWGCGDGVLQGWVVRGAHLIPVIVGDASRYASERGIVSSCVLCVPQVSPVAGLPTSPQAPTVS
jgi:hypothetical protein